MARVDRQGLVDRLLRRLPVGVRQRGGPEEVEPGVLGGLLGGFSQKVGGEGEILLAQRQLSAGEVRLDEIRPLADDGVEELVQHLPGIDPAQEQEAAEGHPVLGRRVVLRDRDHDPLDLVEQPVGLLVEAVEPQDIGPRHPDNQAPGHVPQGILQRPQGLAILAPGHLRPDLQGVPALAPGSLASHLGGLVVAAGAEEITGLVERLGPGSDRGECQDRREEMPPGRPSPPVLHTVHPLVRRGGHQILPDRRGGGGGGDRVAEQAGEIV